MLARPESSSSVRTLALLLIGASALGPLTHAQWAEGDKALHILNGEAAGDQFGYEIANAGDCDGDGVQDAVVGAPYHQGGGERAGRIYIFSGKSGRLILERTGLPGELLGWSVAGAGDVNGDGRGDVVVSAPQVDQGPGYIRVISGLDGTTLMERRGENTGDLFGDEVEACGDWNGDGHDDVLVGASQAQVEGKRLGRVSVLSGADGSELAAWVGERGGDGFGSAVHGIVEGERKRVVIGAPRAGTRQAGRVYVFEDGHEGPRFTFEADATGIALGSHFVSFVGDVNGDGTADILGSDWRNTAHGPDTGRAYIWSGVDGEALHVITGVDPGDGMGIGNGRVGDVNGDGCDDMILGAWLRSERALQGGTAYLYSGRDGALLRTWTGVQKEDQFGYDATGLGDVDGDGSIDFLVSAVNCGVVAPAGGRVYVLSGTLPDGAESPEIPLEERTTLDAMGYYRAGQWRESVRSFESVARREPANAMAWYHLGLSYYELGDFEESIRAHTRASEFVVTEARASYQAARCWSQLGNADRAIQWLDRARSAGLDNPAALLGDPALARVREDPRFAGFLPEVVADERPFVENIEVIHTWTGERPGNQFGWVVCSPGDIDGDGVKDAWIGAPLFRVDEVIHGKAYLYSGRTGKLLLERTGGELDYFGASVASAGDVDADGVLDLLVGLPRMQYESGKGKVQVISGADGELLFEVEGTNDGDWFGSQVWGPGDLDGDGHDDVIVGAPQDHTTALTAGRVAGYSGASGEMLFELHGDLIGGRYGSAVTGLVDGETRMLVVGSMNGTDTRRGRVFVYRFEGAKPELAFEIEADGSSVNFGRGYLSILADQNGDDVPEIEVGDFENKSEGSDRSPSGAAFVYSGADGARLLTLSGQVAQEGFGSGHPPCGDVDGDGVDDLLIGAWLNSEGAEYGGRAYVLSGADGSVLRTFTSRVAREHLGYGTVGMGDVNGDGRPDFLVSAANWAPEGVPAIGRVYLISGAPPKAHDDRESEEGDR